MMAREKEGFQWWMKVKMVGRKNMAMKMSSEDILRKDKDDQK